MESIAKIIWYYFLNRLKSFYIILINKNSLQFIFLAHNPFIYLFILLPYINSEFLYGNVQKKKKKKGIVG